MSVTVSSILLPTDFSELSESAIGHARLLAETFDAQLHCLHVVDEAYQYWSAMGPESVPVGPPPDDLLAAAQGRLSEFCARHLTDLKRPAVREVRIGRPFAEIIAYSKEHAIDLVVMATHGRGAIAHMLLGSTTEKVVRKAACAVMTVRAGNHHFVMP